MTLRLDAVRRHLTPMAAKPGGDDQPERDGRQAVEACIDLAQALPGGGADDASKPMSSAPCRLQALGTGGGVDRHPAIEQLLHAGGARPGQRGWNTTAFRKSSFQGAGNQQGDQRAEKTAPLRETPSPPAKVWLSASRATRWYGTAPP